MFYVLEPSPTDKDESNRTDFLHQVHSTMGDAPQCVMCREYIGMRAWLPPYRVEIEAWGHEYGDLAFFGALGCLLVSQRFTELYQQNMLSGLRTFAPVEIVKVKRHRKILGIPPLYYKVDVVRSETAIDLKASGFEWTQEPTICPQCLMPGKGCNATLKRFARLVLNQETWQGEDIFIPRGGTDFLVSERFRIMCASNDVRNAIFIPSESYRIDFYPWEKRN